MNMSSLKLHTAPLNVICLGFGLLVRQKTTFDDIALGSQLYRRFSGFLIHLIDPLNFLNFFFYQNQNLKYFTVAPQKKLRITRYK